MRGRIHGSWRTSIPTGDDAPDASSGGASEETDVTGSADTAGTLSEPSEACQGRLPVRRCSGRKGSDEVQGRSGGRTCGAGFFAAGVSIGTVDQAWQSEQTSD